MRLVSALETHRRPPLRASVCAPPLLITPRRVFCRLLASGMTLSCTNQTTAPSRAAKNRQGAISLKTLCPLDHQATASLRLTIRAKVMSEARSAQTGVTATPANGVRNRRYLKTTDAPVLFVAIKRSSSKSVKIRKIEMRAETTKAKFAASDLKMVLSSRPSSER